jgi:hypothetical protein
LNPQAWRQHVRVDRERHLGSLADALDEADRGACDPARHRARHPGTGVRFGLDALIGIFPVVGDIVTTALTLFIVLEAYQLGAPGHVIACMLGNVARLTVRSARCPLVGETFDVLWRANRRNVQLLREWLDHERWR